MSAASFGMGQVWARVAIGSVAAFIVVASTTPAGAQTPATSGVAYASTGFSDGGRLLTVDLTTGAATLIGQTGTTVAGAEGDAAAMSGLAIDSQGRIFGTDPGEPSSLWRVDAATGDATLVGSTGLDGVDAIAFDDHDVLYAAESFGADAFYTLDPDTGTATFVGNFGLADDDIEILGMAFDPTTQTLFGSAGGRSDNIYRIDRTTGVATLVGSTGLGGGVPDLLVDGAGNLFGSNSASGEQPPPEGSSVPRIGAIAAPATASNFDLIAIDKIDGSGTVVGPTGFAAVSGLSLFVAAPQAVVEIPGLSVGGFALLALLLAAIGALGVRRLAG